MLNILAVGCGGFLGATLRYLINIGMHQIVKGSLFPYGTLVVNIIGCFAIGFLGGFTENKTILSETARLFIFIGLLGGFTTFSSFAYETISIYKGGQSFLAFINIILQVTLGLSAAGLGFHLTRVT